MLYHGIRFAQITWYFFRLIEGQSNLWELRANTIALVARICLRTMLRGTGAEQGIVIVDIEWDYDKENVGYRF